MKFRPFPRRAILASAPTGEDLRRLIHVEQVRMTFDHTTAATVMATLFALALVGYLHQRIDSPMVSLWLALKLAVAVLRLVWHQTRCLGASPQEGIGRNVTVGLVFLDGLVWGLVGVWFMSVDDLQIAMLLAISLAGIAAVATFTLHADSLLNTLYCAPIILPASVVMMQRGDPAGTFVGIALLVFIVTLMLAANRARRAVVELLTLRFSLDRVAAERAQALDLYDQALEHAQHQSDVKSQFVATMSHELRTPLHGILGLTRLAQDKVQDPTVSSHLALIQRSGEHLLGVINDVLDFSKIEAGHLEIKPETFDLRALLEDLAELCQVTATGKGLELQTAIELPAQTQVTGDPSRIRQVLLNLLGNAIKFTDRGTVRLSAGTEGTPDAVWIRIEDSGIGIAPEDLPYIFEAFHQVDGSFGRRFAGTGLGLTISREIVRAMGGDIQCASTLGQGSCFTLQLRLPRTANLDQTAALRAPARHAPSPVADPVPLAGHILLAEDNDVNALVCEALLVRLGLSVERCTDGAAAVERLCRPDAAACDLVLMDCQMPNMDGFEATRRIRAYEAEHGRPRLPVVALTANAFSEDGERCLQVGMDAHLPKPFHVEELIAVLRSHLPQGAGAAPQAGEPGGSPLTDGPSCVNLGHATT